MITREDVIGAYRFFLNREAESEEIIEDYLRLYEQKSFSELRMSFLSSAEFIKMNGARESEYHDYTSFIDFFKKYHICSFEKNEQYFISPFGVKTYFSNIPFKIIEEDIIEQRVSIPIPNDSWMADTPEYLSILFSLENAQDDFICVELGAGWGPWLSLAGSLARYMGLNYKLIGVEGSSERYKLLIKHLESNQLLENSTLYEGVVAEKSGYLNFKSDGLGDMGAHISDNELNTVKVKAYSLDEILNDYTSVNIIHFDIQGTEWDVINSAIDLLNSKVKYMMIGTHSRINEGNLINLLANNNWKLLTESPCKDAIFLRVDGCQFWENCNKLN